MTKNDKMQFAGATEHSEPYSAPLLVRPNVGTHPPRHINCTGCSFLSEFAASFFLLFVMLAVPVIEFRIQAKVP